MAFEKEHVILTVGGVIASAAIGYLIYRAEARDNAANTAAQIAASEESAQEIATYLPTIQTPALSSSTTSTSSGDIATATDNGGTPAPDPGLEALIAGFQSSPLNSVTLQSTPVAQIGAIPAPAQIAVAPVVIPTLNTTYSPLVPSVTPTNQPGSQPILTQSSSLAV